MFEELGPINTRILNITFITVEFFLEWMVPEGGIRSTNNIFLKNVDFSLRGYSFHPAQALKFGGVPTYMIVTRIESEERNEVFLNETSIVITDHFPLQSIVHSRSSLADFL